MPATMQSATQSVRYRSKTDIHALADEADFLASAGRFGPHGEAPSPQAASRNSRSTAKRSAFSE
jgi:hypothetical protein